MFSIEVRQLMDYREVVLALDSGRVFSAVYSSEEIKQLLVNLQAVVIELSKPDYSPVKKNVQHHCPVGQEDSCITRFY